METRDIKLKFNERIWVFKGLKSTIGTLKIMINIVTIFACIIQSLKILNSLKPCIFKWVILNKHEYTNIADFELFDLCEENIRGRLAKHRPSKEYVERKEKIAESSTSELINELRRRGLKYNKTGGS